ncbi:ankyrin repeat domain-containing protein [Streptomyces sp. DSM 44915]|uniref:Ankyrin repeat domain-containing protein n=1 Tax=Streptomyces chisholmiae TaxID=3075540 RepID=A0ABU2JR14_9ACTN|nr:ankyrin repeat domain-containing protein [Streptomyces sp. DSM 44915]MDT0267422.1 ankyrin repeat domain-containing protein [Streptomyces sp. DSM 44915]
MDTNASPRRTVPPSHYAWTPAHRAIALEDLPALRAALDAGADPHEEHFGKTLLHHAVDVERDSTAHRRPPPHADAVALLLARGADPTRRAALGTGTTAEELAVANGHWLATELFDAWKRARGLDARGLRRRP